MLIVSAAVIEREGRIMLCQRRPDAHNGLKWEFPGGKLEPGESPEAALRRELREELAVDAQVSRVMDAVFHRYPDRDVLVLFYRCAIPAGEPQPLDCHAIAWAKPDELPEYDLAGADLVFARRNFPRGGTAHE